MLLMIVGAFLGFLAGVLAAALAVMARRNDEA
jgi:hypothetical protein